MQAAGRQTLRCCTYETESTDVLLAMCGRREGHNHVTTPRDHRPLVLTEGLDPAPSLCVSTELVGRMVQVSCPWPAAFIQNFYNTTQSHPSYPPKLTREAWSSRFKVSYSQPSFSPYWSPTSPCSPCLRHATPLSTYTTLHSGALCCTYLVPVRLSATFGTLLDSRRLSTDHAGSARRASNNTAQYLPKRSQLWSKDLATYLGDGSGSKPMRSSQEPSGPAAMGDPRADVFPYRPLLRPATVIMISLLTPSATTSTKKGGYTSGKPLGHEFCSKYLPN